MPLIGKPTIRHIEPWPNELRGFDNQLLRRAPQSIIGTAIPCEVADAYIEVGEYYEATYAYGCGHIMLHHDEFGCLWTNCACGEVP